jgi:hypothetical protein
LRRREKTIVDVPFVYSKSKFKQTQHLEASWIVTGLASGARRTLIGLETPMGDSDGCVDIFRETSSRV